MESDPLVLDDDTPKVNMRAQKFSDLLYTQNSESRNPVVKKPCQMALQLQAMACISIEDPVNQSGKVLKGYFVQCIDLDDNAVKEPNDRDRILDEISQSFWADLRQASLLLEELDLVKYVLRTFFNKRGESRIIVDAESKSEPCEVFTQLF